MTGTPGYSPLFNPDAPQPASFDAGRVIHRADEARLAVTYTTRKGGSRSP